MSITVEQVAFQLAQQLESRGLTLCTAESCTGGGLGYFLTQLAGSSRWYDRGFITYSNESKQDLLGINPDTITRHGAVSAETAREMAEGALRHSQADLAIAVTGIAGPTGEQTGKPVGTVWFGLASRYSASNTEMRLFQGDRRAVRMSAIHHALTLLSAHIATHSSSSKTP